jgi:SAM-dependent methyltransferase
MEIAEYDLMYRIESDYWWYVGKRWLVSRLLGHWLKGTRPLDILDVGCGTGANLQELQRFGNGSGCDIAPEAVSYCHSRGLKQVVLQPSPTALPFPDGHFDVVTCLDVIEHVEDDVAMLREVARVLKPDGAALFTAPASPALWSVHDESLHHKRRYRRGELLEKMERAGLAPQKVTYLNAILLPLIVPVRWIRDRITRSKGPTSDFHLNLPRWLNAFFLASFRAEWVWLRFAPLPFGLSLCCHAGKEPRVM